MIYDEFYDTNQYSSVINKEYVLIATGNESNLPSNNNNN